MVAMTMMTPTVFSWSVGVFDVCCVAACSVVVCVRLLEADASLRIFAVFDVCFAIDACHRHSCISNVDHNTNLLSSSPLPPPSRTQPPDRSPPELFITSSHVDSTF